MDGRTCVRSVCHYCLKPLTCRAGSPGLTAAARSDALVSLVSGALDGITPRGFTETAASTLPNSRHLVFPGAGHAVFSTRSTHDALQVLIDESWQGKRGWSRRTSPTVFRRFRMRS
jgi:TAP-like protein